MKINNKKERKKKDDFDSNKIIFVADEIKIRFENRTNKIQKKYIFGDSFKNKMNFCSFVTAM